MIACYLHDYIEIACMQRLPVEVRTDSGTVCGYALNTLVRQKREYLLFNGDNGSMLIDLESIVSLRSLEPNAYFDQVRFNP